MHIVLRFSFPGTQKISRICGIMWYNVQMATGALRDFIAARPHLIWYSKNYDSLDEVPIVEHTLNYGDWDDVQALIRILGMNKVAQIFRKQMSTGRQRGNYYPEVARYFTLYFDTHASA